MIEHELRRLLADTKQKEELKAELLKAGRSGDPMKRFCEVCLKNGYEIYLGELFAYGQDMNDSKLRSTNGGGNRTELIAEINGLNIEGMPELEKLNALVGAYVNLELVLYKKR